MRLAPCLDSTISTLWRQLKGCAVRTAGHYLSPPQNCGCSSVVEHLLAKEDVASSSLVTRSSLCLKRSVTWKANNDAKIRDESRARGAPRSHVSVAKNC